MQQVVKPFLVRRTSKGKWQASWATEWPPNTLLLETPWKLWQSEPIVGLNSGYYWRYTPKQKNIDPVTLIYLNFNKKFVNTSNIFASRFISAEFISVFHLQGESLWRGQDSKRSWETRLYEQPAACWSWSYYFTYLLCTLISLARSLGSFPVPK